MNSESARHIARNEFVHHTSEAANHFFQLLVQKSKVISPVFLGMLVLTFIYLNKCNNDGNLDGIEYFNQGKYAKALKSYSEFLMLYPNDVKTLYNRAVCYEAMGNDLKAEEDYNSVLELEPYHENALLGLSQIFYRREDFQTTINLTESVVMFDKENFLAYYYTGRAYHKVGYWLHALKCYNRVIELNPDYGFAYFHRSSVMISIGLKPLGCHDLQAAVALHVEGAEEALQKYCTD